MRGQKGISYWGVMMFLFVAFIVIQFSVAIGGAYFDDMTMNKVITERLKTATPDQSTEDLLYKEFAQQFDMNGLRDLKPQDRMTITTDGGVVVNKKYEVRQKFLGNIDLIVHFEKTFDQKAIKGGA
jgi:major membrane immunogen (membrane-anchored lipoprotein)